MNKNFIGLDSNNLGKVVEGLNKYLADLNILYVKLHNLHWNVEGSGFFQLHAKFEELYDNINEAFDEVAERILTLGGRPAASVKEYVKLASIEELDSKGISGDDSIEIIRKDFYYMLEQSRNILALAEEVKDQGTVDLMANFIGNYEKTLWMINAYKA
ncbi:MAG: DNA starvation/stationary phase protection protein [Clostridiales bacterium]|uniref:Dps family protein n=1 Tax=Clostridium sp. N3C TaxID=1776758 RepID=UPI00092E1AF0|nr:Dps family protein [Clostridium sp. N3C]NLZ49842.1 DNA starvation/stationary phase protection protein [Clostridiales bacterium]SCN22751.1 DNA protection during starvation protein 2 [Clostridium sp. N3C]